MMPVCDDVHHHSQHYLPEQTLADHRYCAAPIVPVAVRVGDGGVLGECDPLHTFAMTVRSMLSLVRRLPSSAGRP